MSGFDNRGFGENFKRLRRELVELNEMVRLGAGLPGDVQRVEIAKRLVAQWQGLSRGKAERHAEAQEQPAEAR